MRGSGVEAGHFSVGEESVRPPDATKHLVADAQLVLAWRREVKPRIQPVLTKVEVEGEILRSATQKKGMCIGGDSMQLLGTTVSVISSSPAILHAFRPLPISKRSVGTSWCNYFKENLCEFLILYVA